MIFSNMTKLSKFASWAAASIALLAGLTGCGGGGGSAGDPSLGGGGGTSSAPALVSVALSSATVTVASPATVTVTVTKATGEPLAGLVVTFSTTQQLGKFSASTALTDAAGKATVQVAPMNATSTGADSVEATVTVSGQSITSTVGFQMTATNVSLSSFISDITTLAAYGQTSMTVQLAGTTAGNPVNVVANSTCVANGKASLTPATVTTTTGRAVFTYRDNGCGAVASTDNVQISITGTTLTGSVTLSLTSPAVSAIAFVSSSPDTIFLKGSGYVENSNVKFRVNDASGNGVPEQLVEFEPTTLAGGLLLEGQQGKVTKKTDANGEVLVRVNAGTVPTPMRVKATLVGSTISTVSSNLSIAVGLPSQQFFSLSQGTINIEGYQFDGTQNTYTVIASDRLGNPVPDGTAINFVAEGGQVQSSRLTALNNGVSRTTASYLSSQPKPLDGRITIVAYALGEESFLDVNGNNIFDANEDYQDLGDIFIDRLFNFGGKSPSTVYETDRFNPGLGFNAAEDQFVSLSISGNAACRQPQNILLDLGIDVPVKPSSCNAGWGRAYVRRSAETILSASSPRPTWGSKVPSEVLFASASNCPIEYKRTDYYDEADKPQQVSLVDMGGGTLYGGQIGLMYFYLADANPVAFNPMPAGTIISGAGTAGIGVVVSGGSPVPSTSRPSAAAVQYAFDDKTVSGTVFITTRTPLGVATTFAQNVSRLTPPTGYVSCP